MALPDSGKYPPQYLQRRYTPFLGGVSSFAFDVWRGGGRSFGPKVFGRVLRALHRLRYRSLIPIYRVCIKPEQRRGEVKLPGRNFMVQQSPVAGPSFYRRSATLDARIPSPRSNPTSSQGWSRVSTAFAASAPSPRISRIGGGEPPPNAQSSLPSVFLAASSAALPLLRTALTAPSASFCSVVPALRPRPIDFAIARRASE